MGRSHDGWHLLSLVKQPRALRSLLTSERADEYNRRPGKGVIVPYIDKIFRERLDQGAKPVNSGELNYKLTRIILNTKRHSELVTLLWAECLAYLGDSPRYGTYNDVVGAIVCCVHEYARRHPVEGDIQDDWADEIRGALLSAVFALLTPYEDKKRAQNGDVQ